MVLLKVSRIIIAGIEKERNISLILPFCVLALELYNIVRIGFMSEYPCSDIELIPSF